MWGSAALGGGDGAIFANGLALTGREFVAAGIAGIYDNALLAALNASWASADA